MDLRHKKNFIIICSFVLYGFLWPGSTLSNIEAVAPYKYEHKTPEVTVSFSYESRKAVPTTVAKHTPVKAGDLGMAKKLEGEDLEWKPQEEVPRILRDVLSNHYKGSDVVSQERAFKRVISWKEDFENIADKYRNVNWKMLSAIIKAETQGQTGWQESRAKAVGISQIKYQGAWAFLWDALFRREIKSGSGYVKDYFNANLRVRYHNQLQDIYQYLEKNRILVKPTGRSEQAYRKARAESWTNLKEHLRKKYKPGEYQVAVDIAAMYIDHLIITFQKLKHQVVKIKEYVEGNHFDNLNKIKFSGATRIRWNSIKSKLLNEEDESDLREATLARINYILNRFEDPNICSAAYNLGISKLLEYTESGLKLPKAIMGYVKKVSGYHAIFNEIDIYNLYS
jgi:hypothetical protein